METSNLIQQEIERLTSALKMAQAAGDSEKAKFYRAMLECARREKEGNNGTALHDTV